MIVRWWVRVIVTLVLAPIVWRLAAVYLEAAQGGSPEDLLAASAAILPKLYLAYTLPALALIVAALIPAGLLLAPIGADLLIVGVAPLLAVLAPGVLSHVLHDPRLDAAGIECLALAYGLVFGLTVREPRRRQGIMRNTEGERR